MLSNAAYYLDVDTKAGEQCENGEESAQVRHPESWCRWGFHEVENPIPGSVIHGFASHVLVDPEALVLAQELVAKLVGEFMRRQIRPRRRLTTDVADDVTMVGVLGFWGKRLIGIFGGGGATCAVIALRTPTLITAFSIEVSVLFLGVGPLVRLTLLLLLSLGLLSVLLGWHGFRRNKSTNAFSDGLSE